MAMNVRQRLLIGAFSALIVGVSTLASAQTATFSPTSLSFPSTVVGTTSSPLPLKLTNAGSATLTIKSITITQPDASDFIQSNNCGSSLAAGANCTINVSFTPTVIGARSANVTVTDNASGSPQHVPVSGTGLAPAVNVSPMSLTFGSVAIGATSAAQNITLKNTGTSPLLITSIVPWGTNATDFAVGNNCGSSLAVSATCTITATFSPAAAWARTAAIQMTDSAQGSPHVMGLMGNGASGGVASFSPASLTFTTRLMFTSSPSQPVTLNNTGTAPLEIANITTSGDYSQTNNCGTSVAVGGSCTINVTFTPQYNATRAGAVNVLLTDPAGIQSVALTGAGATPAPVTVKPRIASVTQAQSVQYTAYLSNVVTTNVTWDVDKIPGGNSTVGTITSSGLYTPPATAGTHTITAINIANTKQTASVPVVVSGYTGTLTHHNDTLRTGQNNNETALNTGNVNSTEFGKLFPQSVDGQIYGQPLWMPNVNVGGVLHNVVYVVTQNDSVYAFDADTSQAALWHTSFINPTAGVTAIPSGDVERGLDVSPEVGITSTPVIDPAAGIIYVEARTKDTRGTANCPGTNNAGSPYFHFLHALNVGTGAEMPGSPIMICAQVPGNGYDNYSGIVYFNEMRQNNRAGLLLLNGTVYVAFASLEDISPYHGWVLGYTYSNNALTQTMVWCFTCADQAGNKAGIWHGGGGIPADSEGNMYVDTGTGSFDSAMGGGITFAKLTPSGSTLNVSDFFSPFNQSYLTVEMINLDLSSAGPMLFPDQTGSIPHLALVTGKTGTMYLINRDNMGKYSPTADNVVQSQYTTIGGVVTPTGNWGTPAFFNGQIYIQGVKDYLKQYVLSNDLLSGGPLAIGADNIGYPGTTPVISSNGTQNGIVWVVQADGAASSKAATLRAYDAGNIATELYNSGQNTGDAAGPAVKFAPPTVANGKVYVPTANQLDIYGLKP
jgi:hypothetical protein